MTIIYKTISIHECTDKLIVNPMVEITKDYTIGYTVGHPLDDFILHEHGEVYNEFANFRPKLGSVQYVESKGFIFANAVVGEQKCKFHPWHVINTLMLIREYAAQEDILNDIAISPYVYTIMPGGDDIIAILNKLFEKDTITVYTGTEHMIDYHACKHNQSPNQIRPGTFK